MKKQGGRIPLAGSGPLVFLINVPFKGSIFFKLIVQGVFSHIQGHTLLGCLGLRLVGHHRGADVPGLPGPLVSLGLAGGDFLTHGPCAFTAQLKKGDGLLELLGLGRQLFCRGGHLFRGTGILLDDLVQLLKGGIDLLCP